MNYYGLTDKGMVRRQNQDAYKTEYSELYKTAVLVVCDGMGGAKAGNVASEMASSIFIDEVCARYDEMSSVENVESIVRSAVKKANYDVYKKSTESDECWGMGTTLVGMVSAPCGTFVVNVGDSRGYHITRSGIEQITSDHSVVAELLSMGQITMSEARNHPNKNLITRAIGTAKDVKPDVFRVEMGEGDCILLCSDGLSNVIDDQEFVFELLRQPDAKLECEALVKLALDRGAPDNVTAVIYHN